MTTNPENNTPQSNQPYGQQNQAYGQQASTNNAPQYGAPQNAQYGAPQNGFPNAPQAPMGQPGFGIPPQALEDAKQAKTSGIIAIVISAVSLIIFGFLSIVAIGMSVRGLKLAKKAESVGAYGPGKTLNIIGLICGILAALLWIAGRILVAALS